MSMAYHAERMPAELERADYHVSSNIGRTIHASRQSIVDVRACLDWLEQQGYPRIGILGTSLGSCIAFIAAAHDARVQRGHLQSRLHVFLGRGVDRALHAARPPRLRRRGKPGTIAALLVGDQPGVVSFSGCEGGTIQNLLIWARHDSSFLPVYSKQVLESFRQLRLPHESSLCRAGTTPRASFPLTDRRLGHVPVRRASFVTLQFGRCNRFRSTVLTGFLARESIKTSLEKEVVQQKWKVT